MGAERTPDGERADSRDGGRSVVYRRRRNQEQHLMGCCSVNVCDYARDALRRTRMALA